MSFLKLKARQGLLVLVLLGAAQVAVPVSMIVAREATLERGIAFKFETAPVDPVDALRGRFVALNFQERSVAVPPGLELERGQWVYVTVDVGADGLARFGDLYVERPEGEASYLRLRVLHPATGTASLRLPYDRYYLDEHLAPAAERAVWRTSRATSDEDAPRSYALVRVRSGRAVLEDVLVGEERLMDVARRELGNG